MGHPLAPVLPYENAKPQIRVITAVPRYDTAMDNSAMLVQPVLPSGFSGGPVIHIYIDKKSYYHRLYGMFTSATTEASQCYSLHPAVDHCTNISFGFKTKSYGLIVSLNPVCSYLQSLSDNPSP